MPERKPHAPRQTEQCPHCERLFAPQQLRVHMAFKHPGEASSKATTGAPSGERSLPPARPPRHAAAPRAPAEQSGLFEKQDQARREYDPLDSSTW